MTTKASAETILPFFSTIPSGRREAEATLWKPDTWLVEATSTLLFGVGVEVVFSMRAEAEFASFATSVDVNVAAAVSFAGATGLLKSLAKVVLAARGAGSIFTPGVLSFTTRSLALMTGTPDLSTV